MSAERGPDAALQEAADLAVSIAALDAPMIEEALWRAPRSLAVLEGAHGPFQEELIAAIASRLNAMNDRLNHSASLHFRASQLSQAFGSDGQAPLIASLLYCLHGDRAQEGLSDKALPSDPPSPRARALASLANARWLPGPGNAQRLHDRACEEGDSAAIVFLAEAGCFQSSLSQPEGPQAHSQLPKAFWRESERDLLALERLAALGVFRGPRSPGLSDFLIRGQMLCAQRLAQLGEPPRRSLCGSPPANALAKGLCSLSGRSAERFSGQEAALIDWLISLGAPLSSPDRSFDSPDPLATLAGLLSRPHAWARLERLANAFAERGANPNQSGLFFARALICSGPAPRSSSPFELALSLGAAPQACSAAALSAPLYWDAAPAERLGWIDRLIGLGADPADLPLRFPASWHPVAKALQGSLSNSDYAWRLIDLGAPILWRDSETDQSLLHLLAACREPLAIDALSHLLGMPGALCLLNEPDSWGQTPLMVACSQGRPDAAGLLALRGASVDACDRLGLSPLHHAARAGSRALACVRALLPFRPRLGALSDQGLTPAQLLIQHRCVDAAAELLDLRPEDAAADTPQAAAAREALHALGPKGLALIERCALHHAHAPGSPARRGPSL